MPRRKICRYDPSPAAPRPAFGIFQAAALLEMPVEMLRRLTSAGKGPKTIRRGTKSFYTLTDLMAWVSAEMDRRGVVRRR